jgi:hypothetical protein
MEPVLQKEGLYIGASICRLIHEGGELRLQCLWVTYQILVLFIVHNKSENLSYFNLLYKSD